MRRTRGDVYNYSGTVTKIYITQPVGGKRPNRRYTLLPRDTFSILVPPSFALGPAGFIFYVLDQTYIRERPSRNSGTSSYTEILGEARPETKGEELSVPKWYENF